MEYLKLTDKPVSSGFEVVCLVSGRNRRLSVCPAGLLEGRSVVVGACVVDLVRLLMLFTYSWLFLR